MHLPPFGNGEYIPVQKFINAGLLPQTINSSGMNGMN